MMQTEAVVLVGAVLVVIALTAGCTAGLHYLGKSRPMTIMSSAAVVPLIIILCSFSVVFDQEVDGPPPGMVLSGLAITAALAAPFTLLVSDLVMRVLKRREKQRIR